MRLKDNQQEKKEEERTCDDVDFVDPANYRWKFFLNWGKLYNIWVVPESWKSCGT